MGPAPTALARVITVAAREAGVLVPGASRSRVMLTSGGKKHVKFSRRDGEGPRATANEFLAARLLQMLGVDRPGLCLVVLPRAIVDREPELIGVVSPIGVGVDAVPHIDLIGEQIADFADGATDAEVLAQQVVLDWIGSNDHAGKNFIKVLGTTSVRAVDFAASPSAEVWACQPIADNLVAHGGLGRRLDRVTPTTREAILGSLAGIDARTLNDVLSEMPPQWAPDGQRTSLVLKLIDRKEAIRARYA